MNYYTVQEEINKIIESFITKHVKFKQLLHTIHTHTDLENKIYGMYK